MADGPRWVAILVLKPVLNTLNLNVKWAPQPRAKRGSAVDSKASESGMDYALFPSLLGFGDRGWSCSTFWLLVKALRFRA